MAITSDKVPTILDDIRAGLPTALGQAAAAASVPVVDATDTFTHTGSGQVSVTTATSTTLLAAAAEGVRKRGFMIYMNVPWYVAKGEAASASSFLVPAGAIYKGNTLEDVRGYQASGGTVTAYVDSEARS